jgi:hypothetical protein
MVADAAAPVAEPDVPAEPSGAYPAPLTQAPPDKPSWWQRIFIPLVAPFVPAVVAVGGVLYTAPDPPTTADYCKEELAVVKTAQDMGVTNLAQFDDPRCPYRPGES